MADYQYYDVVIVGGGIAGSALALALSGQGLALALVEAGAPVSEAFPDATGPEQFDPRVVALNPQSRALLQQWGVWQGVEDYRSCAYRHMTVWDAQGTGTIDFDSNDIGASALGYIVENRALLRSFAARLKMCSDVQLMAPERLLGGVPQADNSLMLELESGARLRAPLVVAADGARSRVRDLVGFPTREWDYGHHAIVATVQVENSHNATAWQRFLPSGPLAFLPLPSGEQAHYCSIVWSLQSSRVEGVMALSDTDFCAALGVAFEHRLGQILACSRRYAFPLQQRHAIDYVQPGVALVADAAHTIHPLAGQGINLGLQDVSVLAEEVLRARQRGLQPGSVQVLRRYQRRRKGENLAMMVAMEGFKRLFEQPALPLRWLRNAGMRGVDQARPLKRQLMRRAMGMAD